MQRIPPETVLPHFQRLHHVAMPESNDSQIQHKATWALGCVKGWVPFRHYFNQALHSGLRLNCQRSLMDSLREVCRLGLQTLVST